MELAQTWLRLLVFPIDTLCLPYLGIQASGTQILLGEPLGQPIDA